MPLAPLLICPQYKDMNQGQATIQRILRDAPCSIRKLAHEAGLSDRLLRQIRDGERRLTDDTRAALIAALRRWEDSCAELADALEAVESTTVKREESDE